MIKLLKKFVSLFKGKETASKHDENICCEDTHLANIIAGIQLKI